MLFKLIKNEMLKQFGKISLSITIIVSVLIAIGYPILNKYITEKYAYSGRYDYSIDSLEKENENLKKENTDLSKIKIEINEVELAVYKRKAEFNNYYDWRSSASDLAASVKRESIIYKALASDINPEIITNSFPDILQDLALDAELDKEAYTKLYLEKKSESDDMFKSIDNNDHKLYNNKNLQKSKDFLKTQELTLKTLEENLKKNPGDKDIKLAVEKLKKAIINTQESIKSTSYIINTDNYYDPSNSWKVRTMSILGQVHTSAIDEILSEEGYTNSSESQYGRYKSYQDYQEKQKNLIEESKREYNLLWHSLENNIPLVEHANDARTSTNGSVSFLILIIIVGVIVASATICQEFSSGSIRLLLVQPVKRWKILLSKYITTFLIAILTLILVILAFIITNGILYGFNTFNYPVLSVVNDAVVATNYFVTFAILVLQYFASVLFIVSLTFFISILTKNIAVSSVIGVMISSMSGAITMFMIGLKQNWIGYTPFPYLDFYSVSNFLKGMSYSIGKVETINITYGTIILGGAALLFTILSFWIFNKSDIKSS